MYCEYFGVTRYPFEVSPNADCLYAPPQYRDALSGLSCGILNRKGFLMLTGDAGTGKTTLCTRLTERLPPDRMQMAFIANPSVSPTELLDLLLWSLGTQDIPESKVNKWIALNRFLKSSWEQEKIVTIIIDEAHLMPVATLEEVRMLGNLFQDGVPLLQIILSGQNQLNDVMNRSDLRQFKQRIAVRVSLKALTRPEVNEYIQFRWRRAGATRPSPFTPEAVARIAVLSQGIPRVVNTLCDNALLIAYAGECRRVNEAHVSEAAADLDVLPATTATVTAAPVTKVEPEPVAAAATRMTQPAAPIVPVIQRLNYVEGLQTLNRYQPSELPFLVRLGRKLGFMQT
jgi:general secretion pathway protein A